LLANPAQTEFLRNFHVELLAAKLDQCRRQERLRLIINLPPRNLKSLCASVALPAWLLGHNPCGFDYLRKLRSRLGRQACSRLPQHHDEPLVSADVRNAAVDPQAVSSRIHHYRSRLRFATSVGGVLTGRGAANAKPDPRAAAANRASASTDRAASAAARNGMNWRFLDALRTKSPPAC